MNLTELEKNYVTALRNNPNINSEHTINSYWSVVKKFCSLNSRAYRVSTKELKEFMAGVRKMSDSYYNIHGSALKILFTEVFNQPQKMAWFKSIPTKQRFYDIITWNEFVEMGHRCKNSKHKLILAILYSTGIRRSELINIKLEDIDWVENRIFIHSSKGGKNGYVQLHELTKKYLIKYLKEWRPKVYLLNGQKSIQYAASSILEIIKQVSDGKYSTHDFRRTYLTNLIEKENVFAAKDIARHSSLKSTLHYYHIPKDKLKNMYNPLDEFYQKAG